MGVACKGYAVAGLRSFAHPTLGLFGLGSELEFGVWGLGVGGLGLGLRAGLGMLMVMAARERGWVWGLVRWDWGGMAEGLMGTVLGGVAEGGGVRVKGWGRGSVERGCGGGVELSWILENGRRLCSEHGKESGCGLDMDKWSGFG